MRSVPTRGVLRLAAGTAAVGGLAVVLASGPAVAADPVDPGHPDLVVGQIAPVEGVRPGSTSAMSFAVKNQGDGPADNAVLFIDGTHGLSFPERYSNCIYQDTPAQDEGPAQVNAICDIEQVLEPGVVYEPETPVGITVLDRALYEHLSFDVQDGGPFFPDGTEYGGGADPVLRLVERKQPDPGTVYRPERADVAITAENTADFALTGANLKGGAGVTVDAKVTFADKGPAWVANDAPTPIGIFDVDVPTGTTVTTAPPFCRAAGSGGEPLVKGARAAVYRCTTPYDYVDENSERSYVFRLRIDKVVKGARGTVAFVKGDHRWGTRPFDKNPRNDTAALVVNASAGGGAGDGQDRPGGAQGGTGQGSGSTGGSGGSGDSGRGGGTPGATTRNGTLAATGTDRTPLIGAAVGAVLLVAGGYSLTSRRRPSGSRVR